MHELIEQRFFTAATHNPTNADPACVLA
jgi:hypothetical protein